MCVEIVECILDHADFLIIFFFFFFLNEPVDIISCHSIGSDNGDGVTHAQKICRLTVRIPSSSMGSLIISTKIHNGWVANPNNIAHLDTKG